MANVLKQIDAKLKELDPEEGEVELSEIKFPKFTDEIRDRIAKLKEVGVLTLNNCGLESLDNFPKLNGLIRLELVQNKFAGSELAKLADKAPHLQMLVIGENDIKEYSDIEPLAKFKELMSLELANTPLSEKADYREKIFKLLPSLEALDDLDRNGNPVEYDDEEEGDDDEEDEEFIDEDEEDDGEEFDDEDDEDEEEIEARAHSKKKTKK
jgi:acidic leucine-rich nuclear phosphoprotein 32 family protein A/C/D